MTNPPLRLRHVPGANPGWPRSYHARGVNASQARLGKAWCVL